MIDLTLTYNRQHGDFDIIVEDEAVVEAEDVINAALLSVLSNRRKANQTGFGAGGYFLDPEFGSRLWERLGTPNEATFVALVEQDVRESLQWMIDEGELTEVRITAIPSADNRNFLGLRVLLTIAPGRTELLEISYATITQYFT